MDSQKNVSMPITRLSYSDLTQLLRNPIIFKLKKILGIYDTKTGISGMIGRAGHEALKFYYGGNKDLPCPADPVEARTAAIELGMDYLENTPDSKIKFGKTGSRESMLKGFNQAMQFYFQEEPVYDNVVIAEEKLESEIKTDDGDVLPLPCVAIPDIVDKHPDESHDVFDVKFVKSFTAYEDDEGEPNEDWVKFIQAQFINHVLIGARGIHAKRCIFREVKITANKDGGAQIRDYVVDLNHIPYKIFFYNLFKDVVAFISNPNAIYLPNLSDPFDGQQAGLIYAQGLISADMSDVEVMHKVKDVAFTSKKFLASSADRVENQYLPAEEKIKIMLQNFGIPVKVEETKVGASVTQYRFKVSAGVPMTRFAKFKPDIARAIEAKGEIRILAPIPGTSLLGIEVANEVRESIKLSKKYFIDGTMNIPVGVDVHGNAMNLLLNKMPHLLIAGATGSGKSVLIHSILTALTKQMKPDELDLTLIDPKRVELTAFAKVKHLHGKKIVFEHEDAIKNLLDLVDEMDERYKMLEKTKCRDIEEYNQQVLRDYFGQPGAIHHIMPFKVVVIDEMADFMLKGRLEEKKKGIAYPAKSKRWLMKELETRAGKHGQLFVKAEQGERANDDGMIKISIDGLRLLDKDALIDVLERHDAMNILNRSDANTEHLIVRLAQLGRAAGIHLIVATQSPRADIVTGLIKANFPTKIALTTSSVTESMIILGEAGAEKLSGKGDMILMYPGGKERLQGFMI
jgi:hypothetical protein